ncbi:MAG: hypothetical protein II793_00450 [Bacteroidales bacterium]|nr:hypothetical protein [Bacteroidales bacterium]
MKKSVIIAIIVVVAACVVLFSLFGHCNKGPQVSEHRVDTIMTDNLVILIPRYDSIDFLGTNITPEADSPHDNIIYVSAASFTLKYLDTFSHSNIIGTHVCSGELHKLSGSKLLSGAFVYYNGQYKFLDKDYMSEMERAAQCGGCGFTQQLILYKGAKVKTRTKDNMNVQFRALCNLHDTTLCIVQTRGSMPFGQFKQSLLNAGITDALYLDMGAWDYGWYRDSIGTPHHIGTSRHGNYTNWLVFYK